MSLNQVKIVAENNVVDQDGNVIATFDGLKIKIFSNDTALEHDCLNIIYDKLLEKFLSSSNSDFSVARDGAFRWLGVVIGRLVAGEDYLNPKLMLFFDDKISQDIKTKFTDRAKRFVNYYFEETLKPLYALKDASNLEGTVKKIAQSIVKNYGILERKHVLLDMRSLEKADRIKLRQLGVKFGAYNLFIPILLKPLMVQELALLWKIFYNKTEVIGLEQLVTALLSGRTSQVVDKNIPMMSYKLSGYRVLGERAVRVDILERLADMIRPLLAWDGTPKNYIEGAYFDNSFFVTLPMMAVLGATSVDMQVILSELGYVSTIIDKRVVDETLVNYRSFNKCNPEPVGDLWKLEKCQLEQDELDNKKAEASINILLWKRSTVKFSNILQNSGKTNDTLPNKFTSKNKSSFIKKKDKNFNNKKIVKPTKPIDLNSPFAKLAILKDKRSSN
ncbi:hypothetical protein [Bartonella sp. DGB1]|uniref:hypothetical protein n=1 Tax=Bartonella sp. DGB1 TaxID=3239807 RepID=UPI0035241B02